MIEADRNQSEFAPMYTRAERWRILAKALLTVLILGVLVYFFIAPWFRHYLPTAHCQSYGSWNGLELILMVMFVGVPLILGVVLLLLEGQKSLWVLANKQTPIAGEKVMKPTRYRYGKKALLRPLGLLLALIALLFLAVWSAYWIQHMMSSIEISAADCEQTQQANQSFSGTFDTGEDIKKSVQ